MDAAAFVTAEEEPPSVAGEPSTSKASTHAGGVPAEVIMLRNQAAGARRSSSEGEAHLASSRSLDVELGQPRRRLASASLDK